MRWIIAVISMCFGSFVVAQETILFLQDEEYLKAVTRMYEHNLTKYIDPIAFRPQDTLSRQEAAKFLSEFATNIAGKTIDTSKYCSFDDLQEADPTLKNAILEACLLSVFKGTQGKFLPTQSLTKAQALTALLRITEKKQLDETQNPRWKDAYEKAFEK